MLSNLYIQAFLISTLIALTITPLVIKLAWKLKIVDDPKTHKHPKVIHTYPVPRGGGVASFAAILVTSLIFLPLDKHLAAILTGGFLLVVLGILDDKYDLSPYLRLILHFAIAAIPILAGIGIVFTTRPLGGIIDFSGNLFIAKFFALFLIVFMMNILNMGAKGVDGQLPGVVTITALVIASISMKYSADIAQWPVTILALITAGAYLGFLPWNVYPQKIMPSYSGSTLAGFMLAVLSILTTAKVGTLIVVLGIPLVDTGYTILRRILSKKSPVWGDRGHLHHKLYDKGFSKMSIAVFYWLGTALLGFLAIRLNATSKLYTIVGVIFTIGGLLLWLTYRPPKKNA